MRKALFLLSFAFIAASCMKAEIVLDVTDNGSGTVRAITAVDTEKAEQFEILVGDLCGETVEAAVEDFAIERYEEEGFCGIEGNATFAEQSQIEGEVRRALGPASDFLANPVFVERTETGWTFEYAFTPVDEARGVDADDGGDLAADLLGVDEAELVVKVRLPGTVIDHNGAVDDQNFVVWTLEPFGEPMQLSAETSLDADAEPALDAEVIGPDGVAGEDDDGGSNLLLIGIVVAAIAVVVLVLVGLLRRRGADA